VVDSAQSKKELIALLKKAGITELGGKSLADAVLVASDWGEVGKQLGW
jgi:Na+-translocating ferredoxin:NAD+ oxidoreductase RnfC subunit